MNIKAKKFNSIEEFDWKPGSYFLAKVEGIDNPFMVLPCGDHFLPQNRWQMSDIGDESLITLTPSIFCTPSKPCWHGFLTKGEFVEA